jgi:tRNA pseudouridine55 synthase
VSISRLQNAVLLINKPEGLTSFETVARVRKLIQIKKIGHSGTLDKFASGLLVICTGWATKLTRFFLESNKEYIAVVQLGITTDTGDGEGEIIEKKSFEGITAEDFSAAAGHFKGEQMQLPPRYSALKVKGSRASDLARNGELVELERRRIFIYAIEGLESDPGSGRFTIKVRCSKGTYIRSLARDIGEKLGTGAYLAELVRTQSGNFSLEQAVTLEELEQYLAGMETEKNFTLEPAEALRDFNRITVQSEAVPRIFNGAWFQIEETTDIEYRDEEKKRFLIMDTEKNLIAIADVDIDKWHITYLNVFNNQLF